MQVLVVDDDRAVAETVRRMLLAEGWVVDVACDGREGLEKAASGRFDVLVVDIMMPDMNGYELVRDLRLRGIRTPVLMLTAKDGEYDQADAFDIGADGYLTKPFSFVVVIARLRALARRGATTRPDVLTAGTLTLDPATHIVRRGDDEVTLTPKEFEVLKYLMRRQGEVLTKAEILRAVWDGDYRGGSNVVEVYVSYLRRRIDIPYGCAAIETVRGVGYRLATDGGEPRR